MNWLGKIYEDEVPEELVKFLKFVGALPSECEMDFEDAFVKRLQNSVRTLLKTKTVAYMKAAPTKNFKRRIIIKPN